MPEPTPFNGNYIGLDGELHNLDGGTGIDANEGNAWMSPFYGVFINSNGEPQGLETALSGGDMNMPQGGADGQALIKNGDMMTWGDVATPEDITSIQNAVSGLTTDAIPEGETNKYYADNKVDEAIEVNESIMIKAEYAIVAPSGKVDASIKADKLSSVIDMSLTGDISGTISSDLSDSIELTAVLADTGTAGTYMKVTTDAKGRVVSGTDLTVDDVPELPLTKIDGLGTAAVKDTGTGADQIPTLDANGKLPSSVFPSLNMQNTPPIPVLSVDEMLALTDVIPGNKALLPNAVVYMLVADDPTNADNWVELTEDPDTVKQINGMSGPTVNVTTSNVEEGSNLYFTNERADARANTQIAASSLSNLNGGASAQAAINANTADIQSIKAVNGMLKSNGASVTAAVAGVDYLRPMTQISMTLAVASWGAGNTYSITNGEIAADSIGFILLAHTATTQAYQAFMDARMYITSQSAGNAVITAVGVKPTVAIPINMLIFS